MKKPVRYLLYGVISISVLVVVTLLASNTYKRLIGYTAFREFARKWAAPLDLRPLE